MEDEQFFYELQKPSEIKRVRKRKPLSEKQQENWKKALEKRKANIALRKEAQEKMRLYEKQQLSQDPTFIEREKSLKQLLMMLLRDKNIDVPISKNENDKNKNPTQPEKITIQRISQDEKNENDDNDENKEQSPRNSEVEYKYKPKYTNQQYKKEPQNKEYNDDEDEDNKCINIFRD